MHFTVNDVYWKQRAIGFCVIWVALAVYSAEGLWRYLRTRAQSSAEPSAGGT